MIARIDHLRVKVSSPMYISYIRGIKENPKVNQLIYKCLLTVACKSSTSCSDSVFSVNSVMQSDGSSLCGDVVSDSYNKTSRDKDNILDLIYKSKYDKAY